MAVLWGTRQTLDVNAGQALDASACAEGSWMVLRVDGAGLVALLLAGLPGGRVCLGLVLFVPLAGLLEVLFKLLLCLPPALPNGPDLLGGRRNVGVLAGAKVPRCCMAGIAHTGIVPPESPVRKACLKPVFPDAGTAYFLHRSQPSAAYRTRPWWADPPPHRTAGGARRRRSVSARP